MKKVMLKVCGIRRAEDAAFCLHLGVDALGFILHPASPRYLPIDDFTDLSRSLDESGVLKVAVSVNPDPDALRRMADAGFDRFQVHFPLSVPKNRLKEWSVAVTPRRLWMAPRIRRDESFPLDLLPFADTFLIDGFSEDAFGGTGKTADWNMYDRLRRAHSNKFWILAGGLDPDNLRRCMEQARPDGVDLNSGVETNPGAKDHAKLRRAWEILNPTTESTT